MSDYSKAKTYALFNSPNNKKLIAELSAKNIETIVFPTITTVSAIDDESFPQQMEDFDWLIFTDVYTVEYFINYLESMEIDLFELDSLRVCAYGEAVADRLRFSQLHADVIPPTIKTNDVFQAIKDYVFNEDEFQNLHFLVLKKQDSQAEIVNDLTDLESLVTELPVYSISIEDETALPKLKALLKGGAIDEFIFSSHLDVLNLAQLFQTDNLEELLKNIKLTATDKLTLQSLQEFRLVL